jgi:S-adenosylmethionine:tRNA ribosyltransferase-isomerase
MDDVSQYDYELPKELIAQQPLPNRSDARLMVIDRRMGTIDHAHVRDLPELLRAGDCLVVNDSRVIPARLIGYRQATAGRWEGLFLATDDRGHWQVLSKTRGKLQPGERIVLQDRAAEDDVTLQMMTSLGEGRWAARVETSEETWQLLERVGRIPLPPYIRAGKMIDEDRRWYQTVYADRPGSVAAPTAGLHLTDGLLAKLKQAGVQRQHVTLHVGVGTFRPLAVDNLDQHQMHSEWGELSLPVAESLRAVRARGDRVVAVGTTSMRVLESAARTGQIQTWSGQTDLFIRPPFTFHAVDALMTNFHLPRSTLLVLVRTFGGDRLLRQAYDEAIRERYRFYSYGDAMLIL